MCSDRLICETVEDPKEPSEHYWEVYRMIEKIIKEAEKEYELVRKKKVVMRELIRLEKMTGLNLDKAKKIVKEQVELNLEALRRKGVIDEHLHGYLIQKVEVDRDTFIAKRVLRYVKRLQKEVEMAWSSEQEKIKHYIDEYNTILTWLKDRFKFMEIPCQVAIYEVDEMWFAIFGQKIIDWDKTLRALKVRIRCLVDFLESIIEAMEEEEILIEKAPMREVTTP